MKRHRLHVLFEHGEDLRPFGSAYIRLLRPLTHPGLADKVDVTWGVTYDDQEVDAVILDRFWRPDVSLQLAEDVLHRVHRRGRRLIYALDDDLLSLTAGQQSWFSDHHRQVVRFLLAQADGVLVTTPALAERLTPFNHRIEIVPNALDERLLAGGTPSSLDTPFGRRHITIGYMGTQSHGDDLTMILPALRRAAGDHPHELEFQIVGVAERAETLEAMAGLPVRVIHPRWEEVEYPLFTLWFTSRLCWDIALAPLRDTPLNRCKSDIKFLDYCAIRAAGIYSGGPAYSSSVRHLETGWLVENDVDAWSEALEQLISNEALRLQLARNASAYLHSARTLACTGSRWLEAVSNLLA